MLEEEDARQIFTYVNLGNDSMEEMIMIHERNKLVIAKYYIKEIVKQAKRKANRNDVLLLRVKRDLLYKAHPVIKMVEGAIHWCVLANR